MKVYLTREQVREVDRLAIEELGIPGIVLMENASLGAAKVLAELGVKRGSKVLILCGAGNNGGDGYAMARHLHIAGVHVEIVGLKAVQDLGGDAGTNARIAQAMQLPLRTLEEGGLKEADLAGVDWVVDALLGTGFEGELREPLLSLVLFLNQTCEAQGISVLAVDLPSGMDANTGQVGRGAIRADHTATFVARKAGFAEAVAKSYAGQIHVIGIGAPDSLIDRVKSL